MKAKKLIVMIVLIAVGVIMLAGGGLLIASYVKGEVKVSAKATQIEQSQKIKVDVKFSKSVEEVEISVKHHGRLISTTKFYNQEGVKSKSYVVDGFYGKMDIVVSAKKNIRTNTTKTTAKLFADEYNIAPITATMPVTLFSLNLNEITNNGNIPTFVWFKRSEVWDYTALPDNVYTMPVATEKEIRNDTNQKTIYSKTSKWVKELYEINPNSHFHFFYNDYYAYGWMQATIANGIPENKYNVTLLSDGAASYDINFTDHFTTDNEQYTAKYVEMKADYETVKEQIATKKYYKENDNSFEIEAGKIREYVYIMAKEESNIVWWLTATRNAIYDINNVDEGDTLRKQDVKQLEAQGKIVCKALNTSFNALSAEEKESLKELYNFGDNLFAEAKEQNKKAMVLLGTWQAIEYNFEDYVAATMAYYGTEDYVYYYKGHPRNPTPTVDGKMEYLNGLGLIDVDSTIAAELLFFYFPDLLVCTGYDSSTYASLTDDQSGSIWNYSGGKETFLSADDGKVYTNNIECIYNVADAENAKYGSFVTGSNKTILIEELKTTDIYLYDTVTKTIKHLVLNSGTSQYELASN